MTVEADIGTVESMGRRRACKETLVLGTNSELDTQLGTGVPKEISTCQNKHEGQEGERPPGVVSMMPLSISQAYLIKDTRKKEKKIRIFVGVVPGKKEVDRDTESFSPTVHPTVCSAGVSGDSCCGQITH